MHNLTFKPLSGGRYKCNQTGKIMTQKEILSYVNNIFSSGHDASVGLSPKKRAAEVPEPIKPQKHPSHYRAKHE